MVLYAESSAVLAWLLGEPGSDAVLHALRDAEHVVSSALTSVECSRALTRARMLERLTRLQELAALQLFDQLESTWHIQALDSRVTARAREPMPGDPVRTLDALHIASACTLRDAVGPVTILSRDTRVRMCAEGLGFQVLP